MQVERYNSYFYMLTGKDNNNGGVANKSGLGFQALSQEEIDALNSGKVYGRLEKVDDGAREKRPSTGMGFSGFYLNPQEYLELLKQAR